MGRVMDASEYYTAAVLALIYAKRPSKEPLSGYEIVLFA
jgi:hypothetical protein